jgi:hypothetical protein
MADATFVSLTHIQNVKHYRFTIPSINAGITSAEYGIEVPRKGMLVGFGIVAPTSVDFDFTLRQKTSITYPDQDIILAVENINKQYKELLFSLPYFNNDTTIINKLYIIIVNTDGAHASGIFQVELDIAHFDIFGGDR